MPSGDPNYKSQNFYGHLNLRHRHRGAVPHNLGGGRPPPSFQSIAPPEGYQAKQDNVQTGFRTAKIVAKEQQLQNLGEEEAEETDGIATKQRGRGGRKKTTTTATAAVDNDDGGDNEVIQRKKKSSKTKKEEDVMEVDGGNKASSRGRKKATTTATTTQKKRVVESDLRNYFPVKKVSTPKATSSSKRDNKDTTSQQQKRGGRGRASDKKGREKEREREKEKEKERERERKRKEEKKNKKKPSIFIRRRVMQDHDGMTDFNPLVNSNPNALRISSRGGWREGGGGGGSLHNSDDESAALLDYFLRMEETQDALRLGPGVVGGMAGPRCESCARRVKKNQTRDILPCGHTFHSGCIDDLLSLSDAPKASIPLCPICTGHDM